MLKILENAARECGALLLRLREEGLEATDKDDVKGAHFATQGDTASQALGIELIHKEFPEEIIIAEEQENQKSVPADCTVFDPVDGTTNYYNGSDFFGVTFCTLREGRLQWGVMYYPTDDVLISAERGKGCFVNGKQWRLPEWNRPLDKVIMGSESGPWMDHAVLASLGEHFTVHSLLASVWGEREMLLGITGAYINLGGAKVWDAAAGVLAVEEAGGVALDPHGSPLQWNRLPMDWILAANGELAQAALQHTKNWRSKR